MPPDGILTRSKDAAANSFPPSVDARMGVRVKPNHVSGPCGTLTFLPVNSRGSDDASRAIVAVTAFDGLWQQGVDRKYFSVEQVAANKAALSDGSP